MAGFFKYHKFSILLSLIGGVFYWFFAYELDRIDFVKLFSLYSGLFLISFKLIRLEKANFWFLAGVAVLFRLVFLLAIPNLSQDFYRFIWDGNLILEGINPYLSIPDQFETKPGQWERVLINGMGSLSAGNYTSYPPVNQLLFASAVFISAKQIMGSLIAMRFIILFADLGILYFGRKLLRSLNLPDHRIFWFILNPLIIIELTGNLHFEGVMLFFLLWSLYFLHQRKWIWSAFLFGVSVSVKLIPLLFLPLLWNYFLKNEKFKTKPSHSNCSRRLGIHRLLLYYLIVGIIILASFLPFLASELFSNFSASIALWFQKFEFNASVYYLIRWIGFQLIGYNIIATAGKILPLIVILIVGGLAYFRKNNPPGKLFSSMLLGISVYFFLATTVHPWYIATPIVFSVFTKFRFALIWSFLVILSYSAYSNPEFQENPGLIVVEYIAVIGFFLFEIFQPKSASGLLYNK